MTQKQFTVAAEDTILSERDNGDYMYVIAEGRVQTRKKVSGKPGVLATPNSSAFFGEMAFVDHAERTTAALMLTDVEVAVVPATEFETFLAQEPPPDTRRQDAP